MPASKKKLSDKLHQPAKIAREKKISLVKNTKTPRISITSNSSNNGSGNGSSKPSKFTRRRETFLVRLKIDKTMYQKIFKPQQYQETQQQQQSSRQSFSGQFYDPISLYNESLEMNEIDEVKKIEIPDLYPTTQLDIQPEKVFFKHYSDLDNDLLNQKINSNLSSDNKKVHLVLPNFNNTNESETWPEKSPYACWNCTEKFTETPIGIPALTSSTPYKDEYHLEGNFCSFNCAARYLFDNNKGTESQTIWTVFEIMNFIYNEINDCDDFIRIKLAPEPLCLKKFGGNLTLEEYRKNNLTNTNYKVFKGQMIPALYHIQENTDLKMLKRKASSQKAKIQASK